MYLCVGLSGCDALVYMGGREYLYSTCLSTFTMNLQILDCKKNVTPVLLQALVNVASKSSSSSKNS